MPVKSRPIAAAAVAAAIVGGGVIFAVSGGDDAGRKNAIASTTPNVNIAVGGKFFRLDVPRSGVMTLKWKPGDPTAQTYLTTASTSGLTKKLEQSSATAWSQPLSLPIAVVDIPKQYQQIDGFGGALTDSSASLISKSAQKNAIMSDLFASSGARFTMTRVPLGASDFQGTQSQTDNFRSYADTKAGTDGLANFSIAHDKAYIIPLLKQALGLSPSMKLVAAPWSAPGWMKYGGAYYSSTSCDGANSYLKQEYYSTYASYLQKAVSAYNAEKVPIGILSLQNEPGHCSTDYGTMRMEPGDQTHLANELRPKLDAASLQSVKLMAWDHNYGTGKDSDKTWTPTTNPQQAMQCSTTGNSLVAVGYHNYDGEDHIADVQDKFHTDCPTKNGVTKDIYVTEMSGTTASKDFRQNLWWRLHHQLFGPLRHWAKGSLYWNLALDTTHGPHVPGACSDCTAMITVKADGTYTKNEEYYYYAQFSKFIDPGAVRIESTQPMVDNKPGETDKPLETVAFKNPDGTLVVVAMNQKFA
jgi:glucosylceramidase